MHPGIAQAFSALLRGILICCWSWAQTRPRYWSGIPCCPRTVDCTFWNWSWCWAAASFSSFPKSCIVFSWGHLFHLPSSPRSLGCWLLDIIWRAHSRLHNHLQLFSLYSSSFYSASIHAWPSGQGRLSVVPAHMEQLLSKMSSKMNVLWLARAWVAVGGRDAPPSSIQATESCPACYITSRKRIASGRRHLLCLWGCCSALEIVDQSEHRYGDLRLREPAASWRGRFFSGSSSSPSCALSVVEFQLQRSTPWLGLAAEALSFESLMGQRPERLCAAAAPPRPPPLSGCNVPLLFPSSQALHCPQTASLIGISLFELIICFLELLMAV